MSTIDSASVIADIIEANGYYGDDPRVAQIVEYINKWGKVTWGVTWSNQPLQQQKKYEIESEYIKRPRVIWKAS